MRLILTWATLVQKAAKKLIFQTSVVTHELMYALKKGADTYAVKVLAVFFLFGTAFGPLAHAATAPATQASDESVVEVVAEEASVESIEEVKVISSFHAIVTQYSYADSCHNVVEGKCLMASGKPVYVGAVACPRNLKLGTEVQIDGSTYRCEDRYATWVDAKRGMPTIDIFVDGSPKGNSVKVVNVIQ